MNLIEASGANTATQFWISSRYFEALLLLSAPLILTRSINRDLIIPLFGVLASIIFILIMTGNFPNAYVEESGLTKFKIYSEYLIMLLLASALVFLWSQKRHIDRYILNLMVGSILITM